MVGMALFSFLSFELFCVETAMKHTSRLPNHLIKHRLHFTFNTSYLAINIVEPRHITVLSQSHIFQIKKVWQKITCNKLCFSTNMSFLYHIDIVFLHFLATDFSLFIFTI